MSTRRLWDFAIALIAIIVLAPVFVVVAALVRVALGAPVIFRQIRIGQNNKGFEILKFRTMRPSAHDTSQEADDIRMTTVGRILRQLSLDELPTLFNVLRGDMSLVGPRPLLPEYLPLYTARQARRHEVRPGITGWAQVNGRNTLSWEEKFELDVWYVDHRSFILDLRILALTLWKVFKREGISQDGHVTAEPFRGSAHRSNASTTGKS